MEKNKNIIKTAENTISAVFPLIVFVLWLLLFTFRNEFFISSPLFFFIDIRNIAGVFLIIVLLSLFFRKSLPFLVCGVIPFILLISFFGILQLIEPEIVFKYFDFLFGLEFKGFDFNSDFIFSFNRYWLIGIVLMLIFSFFVNKFAGVFGFFLFNVVYFYIYSTVTSILFFCYWFVDEQRASVNFKFFFCIYSLVPIFVILGIFLRKLKPFHWWLIHLIVTMLIVFTFTYTNERDAGLIDKLIIYSKYFLFYSCTWLSVLLIYIFSLSKTESQSTGG